MVLEFTKTDAFYVAEFEAQSDFNVHIERNKSGALFFQQKTTASGNYDSVSQANFAYGDLVIDVDVTALVYPKYMRVVSEVEPTLAEVTFAE
jgi:hypothetical protein